MKKLLSFLLVMAFSVTPCFAKQSDKSAYELYTEAGEALSAVGSVKMQTNMLMSMELEIEGESLSLDMELEGTITEVIRSETDIDMHVDMKTSIFGQDIEVVSYYKDGMYYTDTMGQRVKMEMPIADVIQEFNIDTIEFPESAIKDQSITDVDGGRELSFVLIGEELNEMLGGMLGSMGDVIGGDVEMNIGDIEMTVLIDDDDILSSVTMSFDCDMLVEEDSFSISCEFTMTILEIGGLEIEFPDDLEDYTLQEAGSI